MTLANTVRF